MIRYSLFFHPPEGRKKSHIGIQTHPAVYSCTTRGRQTIIHGNTFELNNVNIFKKNDRHGFQKCLNTSVVVMTTITRANRLQFYVTEWKRHISRLLRDIMYPEVALVHLATLHSNLCFYIAICYCHVIIMLCMSVFCSL